VEKYDIAGQTTDDNTTQHMRIACWTPAATNTQAEYVILIAFPLQQLLQKRSSVLRDTYIACLEYKPDDGPAGLKHVAYLNSTFVMQSYDFKGITQIKFLW
jgi:hypothetical protein